VPWTRTDCPKANFGTSAACTVLKLLGGLLKDRPAAAGREGAERGVAATFSTGVLAEAGGAATDLDAAILGCTVEITGLLTVVTVTEGGLTQLTGATLTWGEYDEFT